MDVFALLLLTPYSASTGAVVEVSKDVTGFFLTYKDMAHSQ